MATLITLQLPDDLRQFVELETAARGSTPGEYLCRLVEEARDQKHREQVETLLEEGMQSGEPIPVTEAYWAEKRQRLAQRSAQSQQP